MNKIYDKELFQKMCEIQGYPCKDCIHNRNPETCSNPCEDWNNWFHEIWQRIRANGADIKEKREIRKEKQNGVMKN